MNRPFIPYRRIIPTYNITKPYYCGLVCENEQPCEFRFKISQHVDGIRKTRPIQCPFNLDEVMSEVQDNPIEYSSMW